MANGSLRFSDELGVIFQNYDWSIVTDHWLLLDETDIKLMS